MRDLRDREDEDEVVEELERRRALLLARVAIALEAAHRRRIGRSIRTRSTVARLSPHARIIRGTRRGVSRQRPDNVRLAARRRARQAARRSRGGDDAAGVPGTPSRLGYRADCGLREDAPRPDGVGGGLRWCRACSSRVAGGGATQNLHSTGLEAYGERQRLTQSDQMAAGHLIRLQPEPLLGDTPPKVGREEAVVAADTTRVGTAGQAASGGGSANGRSDCGRSSAAFSRPRAGHRERNP